MEDRELRFGFDALGDYLLFEALGEQYDRLQDLGILAVLADCDHERAVDLERIERQSVEIAQARIAGAKIVDAQPDAEML